MTLIPVFVAAGPCLWCSTPPVQVCGPSYLHFSRSTSYLPIFSQKVNPVPRRKRRKYFSGYGEYGQQQHRVDVTRMYRDHYGRRVDTDQVTNWTVQLTTSRQPSVEGCFTLQTSSLLFRSDCNTSTPHDHSTNKQSETVFAKRSFFHSSVLLTIHITSKNPSVPCLSTSGNYQCKACIILQEPT